MGASCSDSFTMPVLAVHGEADEVCPIADVEAFFGRIASTDKELVRLPEGMHDMLHDFEKHDVRKAILTWIQARI